MVYGFPLADFWIAITALIAAIALIRKKDVAIPFELPVGSGLIFLGLYAFYMDSILVFFYSYRR